MLLAGCGANEPQASADREVKLKAAANGGLRFEPAEVETTAGRVAIVMDNPSSVPHAIAVEGEVGETVGRGKASRVVADLAPGEYRLFCPVGSHEQAGMVAKLTVR